MQAADDIAGAQTEGTGFGLRDILAALRQRWWLILLLAGLGGSIAMAYAMTMPNRYEATSTVQIDPRKKTIVSLDAVLPDIAGDNPTIESQVELVHSRVIALRVIEALGLRKDPEFTGLGGAPSLWQRLTFAVPGIQPPRPEGEDKRRIDAEEAARSITGPEPDKIGAVVPERDDVAAAFADRLRTYRVRNSLIVEIRFQSRDPYKAARIANAVADFYIRDQIDTKTKATGLAAELLERKLDGLRAKVAEAESRVARFKAEHNIFETGNELLSERQLARLMEQTVAARNATADARARYEQLQAMLKSGRGRDVTEVLQSNTVRVMKDHLARARQREAELLTRYGPLHPELIKARAELADINGQIAVEIDKIVANVRNEYQVASDRERILEQSVSAQKEQQTQSKEVSVKLRDLEREAETSRRVFETFLGRYKQTLETQDLHLADARVVEKAGVPSMPFAPKRKQIAFIGLFAGLGAGLALALALELLTPGLRRPEDAETALGVPHLASVPLLKRESDGLADPMLAMRVVLARPNGAFARAIGRLVEALARRRPDPSPCVLMLASSLPNEGKTVIGANLALALAASGRRTLLVDADLRRTTLSQQLGTSQAPGLADAIAFGQDLEQVILRDTVTGLAVLPAGSGDRTALAPQDTLSAPGLGQRLARLKAHFDVIIIDTPPLLPVVDARIVADYADQILFVAAWERTSKEVVRRAVGLLGANAAKIAGVVINQVDPSRQQLPTADRAAVNSGLADGPRSRAPRAA